MQWMVLGSGTMVPVANRGCACHVLRTENQAAVFDSGSGTKDRLPQYGIALGEISHFIYSHAHLDHWLDLLTLLFYRSHAPIRDRRPGVIVAGPAGFTAYLHRVIEATYPPLLSKNDDITFRDLVASDAPLDAGWFSVQAFDVRHGDRPAQAYRIATTTEHGRIVSVAYSGDTSPCDGLRAAAQDVDCLVCECAGASDHPGSVHMSPNTVRSLVEETKPGVVILSHFYPEALAPGVINAAFASYEGRVLSAYDGLTLDLHRLQVVPSNNS